MRWLNRKAQKTVRSIHRKEKREALHEREGLNENRSFATGEKMPQKYTKIRTIRQLREAETTHIEEVDHETHQETSCVDSIAIIKQN